jgi:hypothetical protein
MGATDGPQNTHGEPLLFGEFTGVVGFLSHTYFAAPSPL